MTQTLADELALERAVFAYRPDSDDVNPFDEVGPEARLRLLTRVRWHFAYEVYLLSQAWRLTRRGALDRAGGHCERCGAHGLLITLEVHHRTYAHLGDERLDELEALCSTCHRDEHAEQRHTMRRRRRWLS